MSKRSTFRPTVQVLETRRCMAAAVLANAPAVGQDTDVLQQEWSIVYETIQRVEASDGVTKATTVTGTTLSGNTANSEGGGLWNAANDITVEEEQRAKDPTTATDDVIVDGKIITAENYDAANVDETEAFFSELGRDDTSNASQVPTETLTLNFEVVYGGVDG